MITELEKNVAELEMRRAVLSAKHSGLGNRRQAEQAAIKAVVRYKLAKAENTIAIADMQRDKSSRAYRAMMQTVDRELFTAQDMITAAKAGASLAQIRRIEKPSALKTSIEYR